MATIPFGSQGGPMVEFQTFMAARRFDQATIDKLGYKYLNADQTSRVLGYPIASDSVAIPYYDQTGAPVTDNRVPFIRLRLLQLQGAGKYRQQKGTRTHARLTPNSRDWPRVGGDSGVPVIFTEGEFKADTANLDAGWMPCVGLGGVDCWSDKKTDGGFVEEIDGWTWEGRVVFIAFDHDSETAPGFYKPGVWGAIERFAEALATRGAEVRLLHLGKTTRAQQGAKMGLDDYIIAGGTWDELVATASPFESTDGRRKLLELFGLNGTTVVDLSNGKRYHFGPWRDTIAASYTYLGADGARKPAVKSWQADPEKVVIDRFLFLPGTPMGVIRQDDGTVLFNSWPGWGHEPQRDEEVERVWENLVAGVIGPELAERFHAWAAWAFQHPDQRNFTSWIITHPDGGVGKSLVVETVARAAGKVGHICGPGAFEDQYNRNLVEGHLFIAVNELAEGKSDYRMLKHYRTADTLTVVEKYMPSMEVPNYMNLMLTSNEMATHKTTGDERRDIIVRAARADAEWKAWVSTVAPLLASPRGSKGVLAYYLRRQFPDYNRTAPAPQTDAKSRMAEATQSDAEAIAQEIMSACPGKVHCLPNEVIARITDSQGTKWRVVKKHMIHRAGWSTSRLVRVGDRVLKCIAWADEKVREDEVAWPDVMKECRVAALGAFGVHVDKETGMPR